MFDSPSQRSRNRQRNVDVPQGAYRAVGVVEAQKISRSVVALAGLDRAKVPMRERLVGQIRAAVDVCLQRPIVGQLKDSMECVHARGCSRCRIPADEILRSVYVSPQGRRYSGKAHSNAQGQGVAAVPAVAACSVPHSWCALQPHSRTSRAIVTFSRCWLCVWRTGSGRAGVRAPRGPLRPIRRTVPPPVPPAAFAVYNDVRGHHVAPACTLGVVPARPRDGGPSDYLRPARAPWLRPRALLRVCSLP